MGSTGFTRRGLLGRGALAAGGAMAFPYVITSNALGGEGIPAASERITMGSIGVGGRGTADTRSLLGFGEVQYLAVCDVNPGNRQRAKELIDKHHGTGDCATYNDFRELIAREDIDAVAVGSPDHWHALMTIAACKSGKDVYCEKPLSLTIAEGRAMVAAARRYDRVFSCGSQRVRGDYGRQADYVDSGALGEIKECYINVGGPSRPCDLPGQPVPEGFDWDLWLGPAPWAPYHPSRCSAAYGLGGKGWRTWEDYSGGMMTDWGGHNFGGAMYALRLDETGPVQVIPPDGGDHPLLTYVFANGLRMYHSSGKGPSIRYVGTKGDSTGPQLPAERKPTLRQYKDEAGSIHGDFLHGCRTREKPFRDVEYAHRVATVCHLGNIAYKLKRPLKWDPAAEVFVGDEEANRLLDRPKREPWRL